MIPNFGPMEILVVLVIALVVFGPKRLPDLGSSLGKSFRGFSKAVKGDDESPPALGSGETADAMPSRETSTRENA